MIRLRVALTLLSSPLILHAQEAATVSTKNEIQDFTAAVDLLIKAGFPDTKGAQYVKANLGNNRAYTPFSNFDDPPTLTGTAWFTPKEDEKRGTLAFGLGISVPFTVTATSNSNRYPQDGQPHSSSISEADIVQDLKAVHKWLLEKGYAEVADYGDEYGDSNLVPPIFSFAVMAHRAGHKAPANALIQDILTRANDPNRVIDTVINTLAEKENKAAYSALQESGDWKAYHAALKQLEKKYPRGWNAYDALSILLPQAELRASSEPKTPSLEGITFKPEIIALLEETNSSKPLPSSNYLSNRSWLFNNQSGMQGSKSPFAKLTEHGLDGFIGLVALLDDQTLILQESSYDHYYSSGYYSSYGDPAELAYRAYQNMARPKTRGEVAASLLQHYFQSDDYSFNSSAYDMQSTLKELALEWYKKHKNATPMELCQYFLSTGNDNLVEEIIQQFIKIGTEESYAVLEKTILESATPSMFAISIKPYIIKRKQAAKPFLDQYKDKLTAELGDGKNNDYINSGQSQISQNGGVEKYIAKLQRYTEPLSAKQLITKLSRKSAKTDELLEQLRPVLKGKPLGKHRPKLIYAAAKSDPEKAAKIISFLDLLQSPPPATIEEAYAVEIGNFEKEDWLKLLEKSDTYTNQGYPLHLASYALLDNIFNPKHDLEAFHVMTSIISPEKMQPWIESQAELLLTQKVPEPYPLKDTTDEAHLEQLINEFTNAKPSEIQKKYDSLSIAESLAINETLTNGDIPSVNAARKLVNHFQFVNQGELSIQNKDAIRSIIEKSGILYSELSEGTVTKIAQLFRDNSKTFDGNFAGFTRNGYGIGFALYIGIVTERSNIIPQDQLEELAKTGNSHIVAFNWMDPAQHHRNSKPLDRTALWYKENEIDKNNSVIKDYIKSLTESQHAYSTLQIITSKSAANIPQTEEDEELAELRQKVLEMATKALDSLDPDTVENYRQELEKTIKDATQEELEMYLRTLAETE